MQSILNRLSDVGFSTTKEKVAEYLKQKGLTEKQVTDDVLFEMLQELEVQSSKLPASNTAALPQAKQTEQKQSQPQNKQSSQLATTNGKKRVDAKTIAESDQAQAEASAKLMTAGSNAQTEFIEKVCDRVEELKTQRVITEEKVDAAAEMVLSVQNDAIDQVLGFLQKRTAHITNQTIAEIQEMSDIEILDAEMVA